MIVSVIVMSNPSKIDGSKLMINPRGFSSKQFYSRQNWELAATIRGEITRHICSKS
jgi:hypothetical protein